MDSKMAEQEKKDADEQGTGTPAADSDKLLGDGILEYAYTVALQPLNQQDRHAISREKEFIHQGLVGMLQYIGELSKTEESQQVVNRELDKQTDAEDA